MFPEDPAECQVGPAWLAPAPISLGPTRDLAFLSPAGYRGCYLRGTRRQG
jgi:hypothetical protein